jgi:hypothetical protein
MNPACLPLILCCIALSGCGSDSGQSVAPPISKAAMLIHGPPIKQLTAQELRSLSMECENYPSDKSARGPYDAAYCEDAMAAWADAPLQIVPLKRE